MAHPKTLNEAQAKVLEWIGNGCPPGVFPVLAEGESRDRPEVGADVADGVRLLIEEGAADLRTLVRRHLADALEIFHGRAVHAQEDPGPGELLDSVIGIYASYESERS